MDRDKGDVKEERIVSQDLFEASVQTQRGELVDVTSLIHNSEDFREGVQKRFDLIARIVSSPEYPRFKQEIEGMLTRVRGQDFLFDIEGVLIETVDDSENAAECAYFVDPWMLALIERLVENGNRVGFWTTVPSKQLELMRRAMKPTIAALPAITMEGFKKVVEAYQARQLGRLSDDEVIEITQAVYPLASREAFENGLTMFTEDLWARINSGLQLFLRGGKYPQLFILPDKGFFIDDSYRNVDEATERGWPKNRAVRFRFASGFEQKSTTEVVRAIVAAV